MLFKSSSSRLPALAAACLLSVALPAIPAFAKEKTKTPAATESSVDADVSVSIPTIDAVGSSISDEVLTEVLSGAVTEHAEELASLDAESITVPEIIVTVVSTIDGAEQEATLTFRDLTLENVTDGVAANVGLSGIGLVTDDMSFDYGTLSAANLNIGGMLGIYGLVDTDQTELETIYSDLVSAGGTLTSDEINCTIGSVTSEGDFKARPLRTSFAEMITLAQSVDEETGDVDPALLQTFVQMYADLLTAFETAPISFDGINCDGTDEEGQALTFGIAGMEMGAMTPGIYPQFSVDGIDVNVAGDGSVSLGNFTVKQSDLTALVALLESVPENVGPDWFVENSRLLTPEIYGASFDDLSIDIPDPEADGERIKIDVGGFDLSLADYVNGIPTVMDLTTSNIQMALPKDSGDETIEQLLALGVTDIDAGFRIAGTWDEAASTIDIEEVSVTGVDLGTVTLAGSLANATADIFSLDENIAMMAGMNIAVRALNVDVVDEGLTDLVIAATVGQGGASAEELRPVYADLAKGTVISLLAGVADAADMGDAIAAFIRGDASNLQIGITAKDEAGIGMADFEAAEDDPTTLIGKVDITAESN